MLDKVQAGFEFGLGLGMGLGLGFGLGLGLGLGLAASIWFLPKHKVVIGLTLILFKIYLNIFVEAFAQEQKCSSRELTLSQYLYLSKSTNVVQVQCMGSDVR